MVNRIPLNKQNITTLETAVMLDESCELLGHIAEACSFLSRAVSLGTCDRESDKLQGIFGVIAYAADIANTKQIEIRDRFTDACGFKYPLSGHYEHCRDNDKRSVEINKT